MRRGLAPDGGLYVPTRAAAHRCGGHSAASTRLPEIARGALEGFFAGDRLQPVLGEIAEAALDFPAPTTAIAT